MIGDELKVIATTYRKYLFRSRLEAKWAAFFDLCMWPWSYEPVDFDGWIPDFAIGERPTLVEIKPFFHEEQWEDTFRKIISSGCQEPVVLLGADPARTIRTQQQVDESAPQVGWILDENREMWPLNFGHTEGNGRLGLCSIEGSWWNCLWKAPTYSDKCTHPNKWSRVWLPDEAREEMLFHKWATACNISRWMPVCK